MGNENQSANNFPSNKEEAVFCLRVLGAPDPESHNLAMVDAIARAAMRNPSADAQILIEDLKKAMGAFFSTLQDNEVESILKSASESRGHLKTAAAVRKFCNGEMKLSPSADFALIDGLLSAMNYKYYDLANKEKTPEGKALSDLVKTVYNENNGEQVKDKKKLPAYIGYTFASRGQEMTYGRVRRGISFFSANQATPIIVAADRAISGASMVNDENIGNMPKKMPERQLFTADGYAKAVKDAGLEPVGHVSGTTPGNMMMANVLLTKYQHDHGQRKNIGLTEERARILGGLTAASFHRSGFHSPLEVLVGVEHYLGREATEHNVPKDVAGLRDLFIESIELMGNAGATQIGSSVKMIVEDLKQNPKLLSTDAVRLSNSPNSSTDEHGISENSEEDLYAGLESLEIKRSVSNKEEGQDLDLDLEMNKHRKG